MKALRAIVAAEAPRVTLGSVNPGRPAVLARRLIALSHRNARRFQQSIAVLAVLFATLCGLALAGRTSAPIVVATLAAATAIAARMLAVWREQACADALITMGSTLAPAVFQEVLLKLARGGAVELRPPTTILFVAANPTGEPLAFDRECAAIADALRGSAGRERLRFESRWDVSAERLVAHLDELRPSVLHFAGHAQPDGLVLGDGAGQPHRVTAAALAGLIATVALPPRLIVLGTCHGEAQADALLAVSECVAGVVGVLDDTDARRFAVALYGALGDGRPFHAAVARAGAVLRAHGGAEAFVRARDGVDLDEVWLLNP